MNKKQISQISKSAERGMTLIEIMIVVAIIGLVMGMVGVAAVPQFKKAQCKTAWTEAKAAQQAMAIYQTDHNGDCPSIEDLVSGKYIDKDKDPWGQPLKIKKTDNGDECGTVFSSGSDKKEGGPDDVDGSKPTAEDACNPDKKK